MMYHCVFHDVCQTSEMEDVMLVLPLMQVTEGVWMVFSSDV